MRCPSPAQAESLLATHAERPIRLLVVDSIAAPFRDVGDNPGVQQYAHRSSLFFQVLPSVWNELGRRSRYHMKGSTCLLAVVHDGSCSSAWQTTCCRAVQIAALLNRYADAYNLAVVVTNQVSDFFEDANDAANRKASPCPARATVRASEVRLVTAACMQLLRMVPRDG